jgi:hypothetical protein
MEDKLKQLLEETNNNLLRRVVEDALEKGDREDAVIYLKDVVTHGCQSGIVAGLVYYSDTHQFFDKYYEEILECIEEYEEQSGEKPIFQNDLKNWYAWFAYEFMARKVLDVLNVEY